MHKSQKQKMLEYMLAHPEGITALECWQKFKIMRAAARKSDLVDDGWDVRTDMIYDKKEDGTPERYARYYIPLDHSA